MKEHLDRATGEHSLTMMEVREEDDEATGMTLLQAVLTSHTRDEKGIQELATTLRACPWVESIDISSGDSEVE